MSDWRCAEHGIVYTSTDWKANVEVSVVMFCPVCGHEVVRDGPLAEIESRVPAASLDEWAKAQEDAGVQMLYMPEVKLDSNTGTKPE